ncbi:MAG TPA: hypothetical protein VK439_00175 [Rubrivivax sp.]|nr:hypothetical protein [Rubrivivax sp.]
MDREDNTSFGVFKPVGHTVISFSNAEMAEKARDALAQTGVAGDAVRYYTDQEMLSQIRHDLQHASFLASVGQEMNLVMAHKALAERGYHWLVVKTPDNDLARKVADCVGPLGAERAQLYGGFLIEELIEHSDDEPQVAESPDRGLDAGTVSGDEEERADRRPPPEQQS